MARYLFGLDPSDNASDPATGRPARALMEFWADRGLTTPITDLQTIEGSPISSVTTSASGDWAVYGPDGVALMWVTATAPGRPRGPARAVIAPDGILALIAAGPGGGGLDLEALQDAVAAMLTVNTGLSKVYDDPGGGITISGLPNGAAGRDVLAAADKPAARAAAGFVTGTPAAGEVGLLDVATLDKVKSFGISAPATIGSTLAVANSTAETVLATWNVAAGDLAAGDVLNLLGSLDVANSSGSSVNVTFRLRVGGLAGAQILASSAIGHASVGAGVRYVWVWDLKALLVALNDHRWSGFVHQSFATGAPGFNNGVNSALEPAVLGTADLSGATTIVLTATLGTAAASIDARGRGFELSRRRP